MTFYQSPMAQKDRLSTTLFNYPHHSHTDVAGWDWMTAGCCSCFAVVVGGIVRVVAAHAAVFQAAFGVAHCSAADCLAC